MYTVPGSPWRARSDCCLHNKWGDRLGVSGLESILFTPCSSWTGPGGWWLYISVRYIRQQTALFLVTRPVTLNLANSIKCVGNSCSYFSYTRSLAIMCSWSFSIILITQQRPPWESVKWLLHNLQYAYLDFFVLAVMCDDKCQVDLNFPVPERQWLLSAPLKLPLLETSLIFSGGGSWQGRPVLLQLDSCSLFDELDTLTLSLVLSLSLACSNCEIRFSRHNWHSHCGTVKDTGRVTTRLGYKLNMCKILPYLVNLF